MINHKGDARLDASLAMAANIVPDVLALSLTGSYGFSDHIAGQAHINFGGDSYYGQLAPGYYLPLGANSVVEAYAGLGYGGLQRDKIDNKNSENATNDYNLSGRFMLPFVQGNIGWHDLGRIHFDMAFGLKLGVWMPDYDYFEVNSSGDRIVGTEYSYDKSNMLVEPQVLLRAGSQRLKFNIRLSYAWLNDVAANSYKFIYDPIMISTGLTVFF